MLTVCEHGDQLSFATGNARVLAAWDVKNLDRVMNVHRAWAINALSSRAGLLALADSRGDLELWTLDPPRLSRRLGEHASVAALQLGSWHGRDVLFSGDRKGCVRMWPLEGGQATAVDLDESVTALASLDDEYVAVGTTRGVVVLIWRGLAS